MTFLLGLSIATIFFGPNHDSTLQLNFHPRNPSLHTIPGAYGPTKYESQQCRVLVSIGSIGTTPGKPITRYESNVLRRVPYTGLIPKHPFFEREEMDAELAPVRKYTKFECEEYIALRYMSAIPFPFFGKTMTHPNIKSRVTFHGCLECELQEQYHEKQYLESPFNPGEADETIIACGANIYKRETRQWLNDMEAEKIHAREFHEQIGEDERAWRVRRRAPIFNFSDPNLWTQLRVHSY